MTRIESEHARTSLSRRRFLGSTTAAAATMALSGRMLAATADSELLEARAAMIRLAPPGYPETGIWTVGGTMPGRELRLRQGDPLVRTLVNALPQPTALHWHGVRIVNAMDGVPGLTQEAVESGETFYYDFLAPDAGTYWYHAHNRSVEQVARGLYGALVVEEAEPPDVDRDEVLILDDWRLDPETGEIDPEFSSSHDRSHAGRIGNFVTTNGRFDLSLPVRTNQRLRLRLINAANARIFVLALAGLDGWTVALDGMPLAAPEPITGPVILGPGQRTDLIVDVIAAEGEAAHLVRIEDQQGFAQATFRVEGAAARGRRSLPGALPPNPHMDVPGLEGALSARLEMSGGAMGRLDAAILDGERKSFAQLVDANQFWAFNGSVGMTEAPLLQAGLGQTVRLTIDNDTAFPHATHLHGMHFREVTGNGQTGPLRDTLLMLRGEVREIAFVADNPGDWLLHCHMLSHAASGMMTWLRVSA